MPNLTFFKHKLIALCLISVFTLTACESEGLFGALIDDNWIEDDVVCDDDTTSVSFKKVAYWDGDDMDNMDEADYDQLTHLIYGYIQVNSDGSLVELDGDEEDDFEDMVAVAQGEGVEVLISIGGDTGDTNLNTIANSSSLRNTFTDNVLDFIEDYDLDGVDLNWQTPTDDDEGELFEELVEDLSDEMWDEGYIFTISVISGVGDDEDYGDVIDSTVFDYVDFVNVRAFDTENSDDLHSSEQDAIDAIDYWTGRCVIQNKLVLGIPLYSAGDAVRSYDYIVEDDTDYACVDESEGRDYNGIPTVISKTEYAMDYAGGVMLQSLDQDSYENPLYSLLDAVNETADGYDVSICD
ncbi:glycoside hydrolase family 18 protein [Psychromonas sp. KJ10-10]|uniref:glycoside hydrolase family 18 protein n=1 Tax=Psychromonas sp. KJ10-10 TaxID=3391823 RepID=UPI0039B62237